MIPGGKDKGGLMRNERDLELGWKCGFCLEHLRPVIDRPPWIIRQAVGAND